MTLPTTETLHSGRRPHTSQFKFRRESLLYGPSYITDKDTCVIQTRIWRHGRSHNGYFLDISKVPEYSELQHIQILHKQYDSQKVSAALVFGKGGRKYLEFYPETSVVSKFTTEGLFYEESNTRLLPCKAMEGDGIAIELNLFNLPMQNPNKLAAGIQATLQSYGVVLDYGRYLEAGSGLFMGEGYAVLYLTNNVDYPALTHTLPYGTEGDYFYITYPNMNTWCRYCHEEGHTKSKCKLALERSFCYGCDEYGHKKYDCPRLKVNKEKKQ